MKAICEKLNVQCLEEITYEDVIKNTFGHRNDVVNFIAIVVKQYIYRQRCLNALLCPYELERIVYQNKNIEKYYAVKEATLSKFTKRWCKNIDIDDKVLEDMDNL